MFPSQPKNMTTMQYLKAKTNILIVDDIPANISLLVQILSDRGYKVRVATNGKLALQSVRSNPPDLILLDIKMPEMDGYEVCRQLKSSDLTSNIPIIFISALDAVLDKVAAFTVGGVDYIPKPFEPMEVLARVEHQLRLREFQLELQTQNAQLQLLLTTAQAISSAVDVDSALEVILANVCQTLGWDLGQAWMPNTDGTFLEYRGGWYGSNICCSECQNEKKISYFAPGDGLLGKVWSCQNIEWLADVSQENESYFYPQGIKGALAIPIAFDSQVLAVLIFFQKEEMRPDERSLQLANAVANQLSAMIQRKKVEEDLQKANLELQLIANLDGLTQVANRRRFDEYLYQEWRRGMREKHPLSLILLDVDYFKLYNDYYGHQSGDECLQQLALAVSLTVKRPGDLVARYGGEEFAVILPNTSAEGAVKVAQGIRDRVKKLELSHARSPVSQWVTISMGVSSAIPTQDYSLKNIIAVADDALYKAKNQGRDRVILASEIPKIISR